MCDKRKVIYYAVRHSKKASPFIILYIMAPQVYYDYTGVGPLAGIIPSDQSLCLAWSRDVTALVSPCLSSPPSSYALL